MGPPEGIAPSIPDYVNSPPVKPNVEGNFICHLSPFLLTIVLINIIAAVPDYLEMNTKSGSAAYSTRESADQFQKPTPVSPTIRNNLNHPSPKNRSKKPGLPEEMPMLPTSGTHRHSDSDTEHSPDFRSAGKEFAGLKATGNGAKGSDNYVNVPSTIINMNNSYSNQDAVSNPSYVTFGKINETRT